MWQRDPLNGRNTSIMHSQLVIAQTHTLRWLTNRTQHQRLEVCVREKEVVGALG